MIFSFLFSLSAVDGSITLGGSQRVKKFALATKPESLVKEQLVFDDVRLSGLFYFHANFSPIPLTSPRLPQRKGKTVRAMLPSPFAERQKIKKE